jgi:hypothetical protein
MRVLVIEDDVKMGEPHPPAWGGTLGRHRRVTPASEMAEARDYDAIVLD